MQINFGKHKGKTSHEILVKKGDYARYVLMVTNPTGPLANLQVEMKRLVRLIDDKPFVGRCSAPGCAQPATRLTAYAGNDASLYPWCAHCSPQSLGAERGKLQAVLSYADALRHVTFNCGGTAGGYDRIARAYATAKGLPKRVGSAEARDFLEG